MISVIVPIYNTEQYLKQCLRSIVEQSYTDLEIICLNDGSSDSSLSIMQQFAAQDSRIRVIDKENQGYGATCNRGISEARGEYISIVEPDDWIEPNMYGDMLSFAAEFSQPIDIIKSAYWRIKDPDSDQEQKLNCLYKGRIKPAHQPFTVAGCAEFLFHHPSIWSALYRREFLKQKSICFSEIPGAGWADNPFLYETLCQAESIIYLDRAYYCYREESGEKSLRFAKNNTFIPMERWHDLSDILDRCDIHEADLLQAHYRRGFKYLNGVIEVVGLAHPGLEQSAKEMFLRMDNELVYQDKKLNPEFKQLYSRVLGLQKPPLKRASYLINFGVDGLYNLKNNGIKASISAIKRFSQRKKNRRD